MWTSKFGVSDRQNWPPANSRNKYLPIVLQINQRTPCHIASDSFVFDFVFVLATVEAAWMTLLSCKGL